MDANLRTRRTEGDDMTDREMLEYAAKAAGYVWNAKIAEERAAKGLISLWLMPPDGSLGSTAWNPLNDDGDALRLAVKLNIDLMNATDSEDGSEGQSVTFPIRGDFDSITEWHDAASEKQSATRRAIVRAAAEIGKAMP